MSGDRRALEDGLEAAGLVFATSRDRLVKAWLMVPIGLTMVLTFCYGIHRLISLSPVSFPASVACMILLFSALILCEAALGDRMTKRVVALLDVPCGFALRYINIFFCPAFVVLPLSPSIGGVEVGKIIAVFAIGWLIMFALTAYMVRALQLILNMPKRAIAARAEEMGDEDDDIPLAEPTLHEQSINHEDLQHDETIDHELQQDDGSPINTPLPETENLLQAPLRAQDISRVTGSGGPPLPEQSFSAQLSQPRHHDPPPLSAAQRWAAVMIREFDLITYSLIFLLVGLPIYLTIDYSMPVHTALTVLCYLMASKVPLKYKAVAHPVLVSSAMVIIGVWILALLRQSTLQAGLKQYTTNSKYTLLWDKGQGLPLPGAGDIFGSVLDVSIVALALPMFQYRQELKTRFIAIVVPNITLSVGSVLVYPYLCHAIGISPTRALSFAGRSLTLALATPATQNLGGDAYTVAPLSIVSGILGVILGPWTLQKLKIPEDDYITRGITMGANSSAIATALLLTTDPRAAAFSSLSMGLFGTITVALTSIPPLVTFIRHLAGT